jgi:hypothetical protein
VHGTATREHEHVTDSVLDEQFGNQVSNSGHGGFVGAQAAAATLMS